MARVSFSQYSMWSSCPHQYKLAYIDGLAQSGGSIHTIFGSAMHETLQEYIDKCLRISKSQADKLMDLKETLKYKMRDFYLKEVEGEIGNTDICTKEELVEFLEDGCLLLEWFQKSKNFNKFFSLKYDELVAIEQEEDEDKLVIDERIKNELNKTLSVLDERERVIVECYFGINTNLEPMTLEAIGEKYGLTKERIRQIKEKAIRKLRHNAHDLFCLINE
jgi:RNA polymerase sigma factor (sigma-70 family)